MPIPDWPDCYCHDDDYDPPELPPCDHPVACVVKPPWWQFEFREMRFADWYALLIIAPVCILLLALSLLHSPWWYLLFLVDFPCAWVFYFLFETD